MRKLVLLIFVVLLGLGMSACQEKENKGVEEHYIALYEIRTIGENGILVIDDDLIAYKYLDVNFIEFQQNNQDAKFYVYYLTEIFPHYKLVNENKIQAYVMENDFTTGYVRASDVRNIKLEYEVRE
jgi:hypothetical protein